MPIAAITAYLDFIPAVLAERRLIAADGASVPHMKDARKVVRGWERTAYGELAAKKKATPGMLKLAGIGVRHVKKC